MKGVSIVMTAILTLVSSLCLLSDAAAGDKKKSAVLSTVDIGGDYEILGLVSYRSNELDPQHLNSALRKKADKMGADYVIGITYYSNAGYVYGTGTAVKLKKEQ